MSNLFGKVMAMVDKLADRVLKAVSECKAGKSECEAPKSECDQKIPMSKGECGKGVKRSGMQKKIPARSNRVAPGKKTKK